jgi:hypothetical protein
LLCHNHRCRIPDCRLGAHGQSCGDGQTCCAGFCVDLSTDESNCGSCGHACLTGELCLGGKCVSQCRAGLTFCGADCVDVLTDAANCGGCGRACPAGQACCQGACSSLQDATNCGACGAACPPPNVCRVIGDHFQCDTSCLPIDDFCTPGGTPCCQGYPCALRDPSASYTTCTNPCARVGQRCVADTVPGGPWCCGDVSCIGGFCGACVAYGQACAGNECCDGVPCTAGRCVFP